MMGRSLTIIFLFSFFSAVAESETENYPLGCKKKLQYLLKSISTISADFTQINYDDKNTINQKIFGHFFAKKPGNIYWISQAPLEQHIIANNKNIWIYDPDLQQVTVSKFVQDFNINPAILLIGNIEGNELIYDIKCSNNHFIDFTLVPTNTESLYKKIQISFDNKIPSSMKLWSSLSHRSEIYFTKTVLNKEINQSFEFYPPDGADVIKYK
jgi:outer membrane lipoprotein carrier protein